VLESVEETALAECEAIGVLTSTHSLLSRSVTVGPAANIARVDKHVSAVGQTKHCSRKVIRVLVGSVGRDWREEGHLQLTTGPESSTDGLCRRNVGTSPADVSRSDLQRRHSFHSLLRSGGTPHPISARGNPRAGKCRRNYSPRLSCELG
jgi:hypothetical protein